MLRGGWTDRCGRDKAGLILLQMLHPLPLGNVDGLRVTETLITVAVMWLSGIQVLFIDNALRLISLLSSTKNVALLTKVICQTVLQSLGKC